MKFSLKTARSFGWEGLKGWAYNSKEDFENASAAYFEVTKGHGKVKTRKSDRVYYVVDGHGEFIIDGKIVQVEKTDVVIVPKNTPYDYKALSGAMKLFLVHCPAYDAEFEEKLE
ncbi:MAG: cupin domain-containing protein [Nanoarchaeota archaeon]